MRYNVRVKVVNYGVCIVCLYKYLKFSPSEGNNVMRTWKRVLAVLLCGVMMTGGMAGCEKKKAELQEEQILNFTEPAKGDKIVVMSVKDYGDITFRLFPEQCPKGVENFLGLIEKGYYDELIFHRVVKDFVIQGGDPKGDGTGGESLWGGEGFAQETTSSLRHYTGALAYAVSSTKLNKSQFYVVTGQKTTASDIQQIESRYGKKYTDKVKELYYQYGGQPYLDGDYEVFGQVIDGLDVCMKINNVAVSNSKPKSQVQIEKVVVEEYDGSGVHFTAE